MDAAAAVCDCDYMNILSPADNATELKRGNNVTWIQLHLSPPYYVFIN